MASDYRIHLNFLPVVDLPAFTVHRQERVSPQEDRPSDEVMGYSLPTEPQDPETRASYWVTFEPALGFVPWQAAPTHNTYLTRRMLFWSLLSATRRVLKPGQFLVPDNAFIEEVSFIQRSHAEGDELLVVQPYYLRVTREFGYLVDFHFRVPRGVPSSRRIQQLSLSLDSSFRRNLDYYVDRSSKARRFVRERGDVFQSLQLPGDAGKIFIANDLAALPADRLRSKVYIFAGNRESRSQFTGLRDYGPLQPVDGSCRLLFLFREQDREEARRFALSLRGTRQRERFSFPGFDALFKCKLQIDSNPLILPDLTRRAIDNALKAVIRAKQAELNVIPVLVLPADDDDSYLTHKALFTQAGIPTQVCTLRVLQDEDTLKWAIASLALQIFCKAGGYPWKVRPTPDRSLIIGISQSHKAREYDGGRLVEKYFAFSVMTDSSGLFQKIQVLGEDPNEGNYLAKLRQNLSDVLRESAEQFSRVVVHTSFKLKHREIEAIKDAVRGAATSDLANRHFAVVKVNHKSRFFGVNRGVNSLVPYEATRVKLGPGEYLLWFEGIFPDRPTVTKAFPGPTHLQFLKVGDGHRIPDDVLLQDLINLSGANWRGFNAKSAPVSVFYCHLVADLISKFHERGLPLPAVQDIRPWFL